MAATSVSAEARENLQTWLKVLQTPGLSQDDMADIYSDWADKADYDTVRFIPILLKVILYLFRIFR